METQIPKTNTVIKDYYAKLSLWLVQKNLEIDFIVDNDQMGRKSFGEWSPQIIAITITGAAILMILISLMIYFRKRQKV